MSELDVLLGELEAKSRSAMTSPKRLARPTSSDAAATRPPASQQQTQLQQQHQLLLPPSLGLVRRAAAATDGSAGIGIPGQSLGLSDLDRIDSLRVRASTLSAPGSSIFAPAPGPPLAGLGGGRYLEDGAGGAGSCSSKGRWPNGLLGLTAASSMSRGPVADASDKVDAALRRLEAANMHAHVAAAAWSAATAQGASTTGLEAGGEGGMACIAAAVEAAAAAATAAAAEQAARPHPRSAGLAGDRQPAGDATGAAALPGVARPFIAAGGAARSLQPTGGSAASLLATFLPAAGPPGGGGQSCRQAGDRPPARGAAADRATAEQQAPRAAAAQAQQLNDAGGRQAPQPQPPAQELLTLQPSPRPSSTEQWQHIGQEPGSHEVGEEAPRPADESAGSGGAEDGDAQGSESVCPTCGSPTRARRSPSPPPRGPRASASGQDRDRPGQRDQPSLAPAAAAGAQHHQPDRQPAAQHPAAAGSHCAAHITRELSFAGSGRGPACGNTRAGSGLQPVADPATGSRADGSRTAPQQRPQPAARAQPAGMGPSQGVVPGGGPRAAGAHPAMTPTVTMMPAADPLAEVARLAQRRGNYHLAATLAGLADEVRRGVLPQSAPVAQRPVASFLPGPAHRPPSLPADRPRVQASGPGVGGGVSADPLDGRDVVLRDDAVRPARQTGLSQEAAGLRAGRLAGASVTPAAQPKEPLAESRSCMEAGRQQQQQQLAQAANPEPVRPVPTPTDGGPATQARGTIPASRPRPPPSELTRTASSVSSTTDSSSSSCGGAGHSISSTAVEAVASGFDPDPLHSPMRRMLGECHRLQSAAEALEEQGDAVVREVVAELSPRRAVAAALAAMLQPPGQPGPGGLATTSLLGGGRRVLGTAGRRI